MEDVLKRHKNFEYNSIENGVDKLFLSVGTAQFVIDIFEMCQSDFPEKMGNNLELKKNIEQHHSVIK